MPTELTSDLIRISLQLRKICRPDGSLLAALFLDLPDQKYYPDYYGLIKNPICLKSITRKLRDALYRTVTEITEDIRIMCQNALIYNGEDSFVYKDALTIQAEYLDGLSKLIIPECYMAPLDPNVLPLVASEDYNGGEDDNGCEDDNANLASGNGMDGDMLENDESFMDVDAQTGEEGEYEQDQGDYLNELEVDADMDIDNDNQSNEVTKPVQKKIRFSISGSK